MPAGWQPRTQSLSSSCPLPDAHDSVPCSAFPPLTPRAPGRGEGFEPSPTWYIPTYQVSDNRTDEHRRYTPSPIWKFPQAFGGDIWCWCCAAVPYIASNSPRSFTSKTPRKKQQLASCKLHDLVLVLS
ncbi:hypothetical protein QC763_605380 [Podospora pseudopauciseta]|uniref:Uncharacterized protein n=1 Tax=Podospora pseudopauciseta TaxID=2093780 RepID=A0ABR0H3N0_9PEZI|nr:hypothetical protein QC763_605380 [Podospora pseudopauciseta]